MNETTEATVSEHGHYLDLSQTLENHNVEEHLPIFEELINELNVELDF